MNVKTDKPTVFISYSHKDKEYRKQLHSHLGVLEKTGRITVWDDRQIDGGEKWYPEIIKAMEKAAIAVCLISPDFLKSDFINKEEVPFLLQKRRNEGMLILPVLVRPCLWNIVEWIEETQMLPRDGKSIYADFRGNEDTAWNEIAKRIFDVIDQKGYAPPPPPPPEWPELPEEFISIERLPQTGKDVFGRKREIALLDKAWEDETRIIAFIASGGFGKSALINKWADRMKKDNFQGASRVFAWSFYSQGTSKTISSSDQFIFEALCWFGERQIAESALSPWEKGAKLAEIIGSRKTLLFLDGIEPLQSEWKYERGLIKDPALSVLIKELAKKNRGLCVITSRENLPCLKPYKKWALQENLDQISPDAGRTILRVAGIKGTDEELEQVTRDFGNHALAISLLSSYLQSIPGRKASEAYSIPDLDIPIKEGRHPKRLLNAFTMRFGEGAELEALSLLGLFDRPVSKGEIQCILKKPAIPGLTDHIYKMKKGDWERLILNLRQLRLFLPESHHNIGGLDAHPLVREYFGERLKEKSPEAWKEAHGRLYEFYRNLPEKELPDTIEEMAPLFLSLIHGCKAGRFQVVWDEIYWKRILRGNEHFQLNILGAFGADISAISGFFDPPWKYPVKELTENNRSWLLNTAAIDLRALGRLGEAVELFKLSLEMCIKLENWKESAIRAGNLSELSLTLGNIGEAIRYGEECVRYADKSGDKSQRLSKRTTLADALFQSGDMKKAEELFLEAEAMQKERQPEYHYLYSLWGFRFCDLILSRGDYKEARKRGENTLKWVKEREWLLDIALDHLTLGRASLLSGDMKDAGEYLNLAVDGLRKSGALEFISRGLISRSGFFRMKGDFSKAMRDLEEAWEISTRSGMKLWICDIHIESCRFLLSLIKANNLEILKEIAPESPFAAFNDSTEPRSAAKSQLEEASKIIEETGYHRRDAEILLETAHLQIVEGKKAEVKNNLHSARKTIDESGLHSWDKEYHKLSGML